MANQNDLSKRGRSSREKGKKGELELVRILRDFYGYPVRRGKVFYHESDVVGLDGIHIEVKRRDPLRLRDAMVQAVKEAKIRNDGMPTVFARVDRRPWIVCSLFNDFVRLDPNSTTPMMMQEDRKVMENPYQVDTTYRQIKVEGQPLVVVSLERWMDLYGAWIDGK